MIVQTALQASFCIARSIASVTVIRWQSRLHVAGSRSGSAEAGSCFSSFLLFLTNNDQLPLLQLVSTSFSNHTMLQSQSQYRHLRLSSTALHPTEASTDPLTQHFVLAWRFWSNYTTWLSFFIEQRLQSISQMLGFGLGYCHLHAQVIDTRRIHLKHASNINRRLQANRYRCTPRRHCRVDRRLSRASDYEVFPGSKLAATTMG